MKISKCSIDKIKVTEKLIIYNDAERIVVLTLERIIRYLKHLKFILFYAKIIN